MKARYIILTAAIALGALASKAQQQQQFSQYIHNPYILNPALSGLNAYTDITMSGRMQWSGLANAPRTMYLSGSTALGVKAPSSASLGATADGNIKRPAVPTGNLRHGVGGVIMSDQYGPFTQTSVMATYAIHLPVMDGYNISFGVGTGWGGHSFNQDDVIILDPSDAGYNAWLANGSNQSYLNVNSGLSFYSKDLLVSYGVSNLLGSNVAFSGEVPDFDQQIHHYIYSQYAFEINKDWTVTPGAMVKMMSPAPLSMEFIARATYGGQFYGGFGYRHQDALIAFFGADINQMFRLGYSYDFTLSDIGNYSSGSHEVVLGVMLGR